MRNILVNYKTSVSGLLSILVGIVSCAKGDTASGGSAIASGIGLLLAGDAS